MKTIKTLLFIALNVIASSSLFAQIPPYLPSNGLVGYWSFDGNTNDLSGNNNNGTIVGTSSFDINRFGESNKSYSFNGAQYISINSSPSLQSPTSAITISAWIYIQDWDVSIQGKWAPILCTSRSSIGAPQYRLTLKDTAIDFTFESMQTISTPKFELNRWYFVVVTSNKTSIDTYINGSLSSVTYPNVTTIPSFQNLEIGRDFIKTDATHQTHYFHGKLDDIGIWNRELTQTEISNLYKNCNMSSSSIQTTNNPSFCLGDSIILRANLVGASYQYNWSLNNMPLSEAKSSTYSAKQAGNYRLRIDSSGCSSLAPLVIVKSKPVPVVSTSISPYIQVNQPNITLTGTPSGGVFSGVGLTKNIFNPAIAKVGAKTIKYTYTDTNGCSNTAIVSTIVFDTISCVKTVFDTIVVYDSIAVTDTLIIKATLTGLSAPNNQNILKIYPNPASTFISIDYGNYLKMSGYKLKIDNSIGQEVYNELITSQQTTINLSGWTGKGLYFIRILDSSANVIETRKILLK